MQAQALIKALEAKLLVLIERDYEHGGIGADMRDLLRLVVVSPPETARQGLEWLLTEGEWQSHPQAAATLARLRQSV